MYICLQLGTSKLKKRIKTPSKQVFDKDYMDDLKESEIMYFGRYKAYARKLRKPAIPEMIKR